MVAICRFYKATPSEMVAWGNEDGNEKVKQFILYLKRNAKPYAGKRRSHELSVNSVPQYFTLSPRFSIITMSS